MVGLHHYAPPLATDRSTDDVRGVKLECTRCRKSKVVFDDSSTLTGGGPMGTAPRSPHDIGQFRSDGPHRPPR
jgi:hypothetical protein